MTTVLEELFSHYYATLINPLPKNPGEDPNFNYSDWERGKQEELDRFQTSVDQLNASASTSKEHKTPTECLIEDGLRGISQRIAALEAQRDQLLAFALQGNMFSPSALGKLTSLTPRAVRVKAEAPENQDLRIRCLEAELADLKASSEGAAGTVSPRVPRKLTRGKRHLYPYERL